MSNPTQRELGELGELLHRSRELFDGVEDIRIALEHGDHYLEHQDHRKLAAAVREAVEGWALSVLRMSGYANAAEALKSQDVSSLCNLLKKKAVIDSGDADRLSSNTRVLNPTHHARSTNPEVEPEEVITAWRVFLHVAGRNQTLLPVRSSDLIPDPVRLSRPSAPPTPDPPGQKYRDLSRLLEPLAGLHFETVSDDPDAREIVCQWEWRVPKRIARPGLLQIRYKGDPDWNIEQYVVVAPDEQSARETESSLNRAQNTSRWAGEILPGFVALPQATVVKVPEAEPTLQSLVQGEIDRTTDSHERVRQHLTSIGRLLGGQRDEDPTVMSTERYLQSVSSYLVPDAKLELGTRKAKWSKDGAILRISDLLDRLPPDGDFEVQSLTDLLYPSGINNDQNKKERVARYQINGSVPSVAKNTFDTIREGLHVRWDFPEEHAHQIRTRLEEGMDVSVVFVVPDDGCRPRMPQEQPRLLSPVDFVRTLRECPEVRMWSSGTVTGLDSVCIREHAIWRLPPLYTAAPLGTDVAAYELWLLAETIDGANLSPDEIREAIQSIDGYADARTPRARRLAQMLGNLWDASITEGLDATGIAVARLHAALTTPGLHSLSSEQVECLNTVVAYAIDRISGRLRQTETEPTEAEPHSVPRLQDLWREALRDDGLDVGAKAQALVAELARVESTLGDRVLTAVQASVLDQIRAGETAKDEHPFLARRHVVIAGPTSSGKSTVADLFLLWPHLFGRRRKCAIYIAPTKALAQAHHRELRSRYCNSVGEENGRLSADQVVLSTSDDTEFDLAIMHGRFAIACMVYEKATMLFSRSRDALDTVGVMVVDEVHMLADIDRGPTLELAITKAVRAAREDHDEFLRLVVISTESVEGAGLHGWMSTIDPSDLFGTGASLPPIMIEGARRPRVINHELVLAPSSTDRHFDIESIARFGLEDARVLTNAQRLDIARRVELRSTTRRATAERIGSHRSGNRQRFNHFLDDWLHRFPLGRRLLCFVPGRATVGELAEELAQRRTVGRRQGSGPFAVAMSEGISEQAPMLHRQAEKGVFQHYSDLPRQMRKITESHFSLACGEDNPSEVLFCTETLSYGVNLKVDDVLVHGVKFPAADRERMVGARPLSASAFHNMVGRCGRYGQTSGAHDATVYVLAELDENVESTILRPYYRDVPPLESRLWTETDRRLMAAMRSMNTSPAVGLSTPFVRALLDALRHTGFLNELTGEPQQSATVSQVMALLQETLFGYCHFGLTGDAVNHKAIEHFTRVVSSVLHDCRRPGLSIVGPVLDGTNEDHAAPGERIHLTERGRAIIDTGTEIKTLPPMLRAMGLLRLAWEASVGSTHRRLPVQLYLLCIVLQKEVLRSFQRDTPEGRDNARKPLTPDQESARDRYVLSEFAKAVDEACRSASLSTHEMDDLRRHLRTLVRDVLEDRTGSDRPTPRYWTVLRLFAAAIGWLRGTTPAGIRRIATQRSGQTGRGRPFGVRRFAEQLSWKTLLLAQLIEKPGESDAFTVHDGPAAARETQILAAQLRHGCPARAIPFFTPVAGRMLSRPESQWLLQVGLAPSDIVASSLDDLKTAPFMERARTIRDARAAVRQYAINSVRETRLELTVAIRQKQVREHSFGARLLESIEPWFKRLSRKVESEQDFTPPDLASEMIEAAARCPNWHATSASDSAVGFTLRSTWRKEPGQHSAPGQDIETLSLSVLPLATRSDGMVYLRGRWVDPSGLKPDRPQDPRVLIPMPWLPHRDPDWLNGLENLAPTVVCSPATFATLMMLHGREFFGLDTLREALLGEIHTSPLGTNARWLGMQELVTLLDQKGAELPEPIRASLVRFFEPRPPGVRESHDGH